MHPARKRFSNLVPMPPDKVYNKPLTELGVDNMIAADFREWLWNAFDVGASFLDLISSQKSPDSYAAFVEDSLLCAAP